MGAGAVQPTLQLYTVAMRLCNKGGLWERALGLMAEMRAAGVAPNVITYNALIRACGKSGKWELSRKAFVEMMAVGVAPNTFTFNSLITSCSVDWRVRAIHLPQPTPGIGFRYFGHSLIKHGTSARDRRART